MAVLQAYEVLREDNGINFITITEEHRLALFLDMLLASGVPRPCGKTAGAKKQNGVPGAESKRTRPAPL